MKRIVQFFKFIVFCMLCSVNAFGAPQPLAPILRAEFLEDRVRELDAKILIGVIDSSAPTKWLSHNAVYQDLDNNHIMNSADAGFFEPGSTIKIAVATAYFEKYATTNAEERKKLQDMLVVSDNVTTNRVIADLGFGFINSVLRERNVSNHILSRYMMQTRGESSRGCQEAEQIPGNCASAEALANILLRLAEPNRFAEPDRFRIEDQERKWVLSRLAALPSSLGYDEPDESCRLLERSYKKLKMQSRIELVYAKCGISPFNNHWTEVSYLKGSGTRSLVSVVSVKGASRSEEENYRAMNALAFPLYSHILP